RFSSTFRRSVPTFKRPSGYSTLRNKRFLEKADDLSVEVAMKRLSIEARSVGTNLRNLFCQRLAAGRKECEVPRPIHDVFLGGLGESLPNHRGVPRVRHLLIVRGSPQLNRNFHIFQRPGPAQ